MAEKQLQVRYDHAVSRDGFEFDPTSFRWRLSRDVVVNLSWAQKRLSYDLLDAYMGVLRYYADTASAKHTSNLNEWFKAFVRFTVEEGKCLESVCSTDLINYRASLDTHHEYLLGSLRGLFKTWFDQGRFGVDADAVELLDGWRLRGNQKGRAVQTLCPYEGALSDLEYQALQQALLDAFEQDEVSLEDYVLVNLFMATGRRPSQIADLKIKDLVEAESSDGLQEFVLRVPRRKQRGVGWREQFRDFALAPELGAAIKTLIQQVERHYRAKFDHFDGMENLPVFPSWKRLTEYSSHHSGQMSDVLRRQWSHRNPGSLGGRLKHVVQGLQVYSERTGKPLEVFPMRLRRTMGTRAAREGYGPLIIGELLDHSDTQNAFVYTENVPEHLDRIDRAVAEQLAPIAQAFAGVLVDRESDAQRGDDLTSRVRSNESTNGVGTCGHYGFCGAFAPIACYTCRHYQPWLDGPHEEVLDHLLAERERIKAKTNDPEMAAINDRTIFAVQQVVQLCDQHRCEREDGPDG